MERGWKVLKLGITLDLSLELSRYRFTETVSPISSQIKKNFPEFLPFKYLKGFFG